VGVGWWEGVFVKLPRGVCKNDTISSLCRIYLEGLVAKYMNVLPYDLDLMDLFVIFRTQRVFPQNSQTQRCAPRTPGMALVRAKGGRF
jgi:hypothetical protein